MDVARGPGQASAKLLTTLLLVHLAQPGLARDGCQQSHRKRSSLRVQAPSQSVPPSQTCCSTPGGLLRGNLCAVRSHGNALDPEVPGPTWQNDPAKTSSANMWGTNEINEKNQNMRETYRTMSPMWHSMTLSQRKRTIQPLLLPKHTLHQTLQFAANKTKIWS